MKVVLEYQGTYLLEVHIYSIFDHQANKSKSTLVNQYGKDVWISMYMNDTYIIYCYRNETL